MDTIDMINKQGERWKRNVCKCEKKRDTPDFDPFAYGYALGWYKALQAFKGWIKEHGL